MTEAAGALPSSGPAARPLEQHVRRLPPVLRPPPDARERCFHLHALEVAGPRDAGTSETSLLGLLLCTRLKDAQFWLHLPGSAVLCRLRALSASPLPLSDEELRQAAAWSLGALSLFRVPVEHLAALLAPDSPTLVLDDAIGEFRLGPPIGGGGARAVDEPYVVAVPLVSASGGIDWPLLRLGLRVFGTCCFPPLAEGLACDGESWTDGELGVKIPLPDVVVAGYAHGGGRKRRMRRQFFTGVAVHDAALAAGSSPDSAAAPATVSADEVVHRSCALAGASMEPLPSVDGARDRGQYSLSLHGCLVVPVPAPAVRALHSLPAALWRTECALGAEALQCWLGALVPPVRADAGLLRRALT
eukprot:CAMPEP_0117459360 /NCGR_PEP_ID=MMETSP0784-20121206/1435_1 /TAXON_ID=39447 /ORGANISM="" /LENGTH=358 /DNA_ID=CAMNT_0005252965 /DNA_START=80 /DNA_END=1152 /DNA_ORIENTATION=-